MARDFPRRAGVRRIYDLQASSCFTEHHVGSIGSALQFYDRPLLQGIPQLQGHLVGFCHFHIETALTVQLDLV